MTVLNLPAAHELLSGDPRSACALQGLNVTSPTKRDRVSQQGRQFFRYLPETASNSDEAVVTGVGMREVVPGEAYTDSNHPNLYNFKWCTGRVLPEYQIVYITDAHGEFESAATGLVRFHGDALIFLLPGVWHRYRPMRDTGWTERWVSLSGEAVAHSLSQAGVTPHRAIVTPEQVETLRQGFDGVLNLVQQYPSQSGHAVASMVLGALFDAIGQTTNFPLGGLQQVGAIRSASLDEHEIEDEIVQAAIEIIWNDTHTPPLAVANVARKLPVTRRTLDRRFSESLGRSVLDEINACRFARAKRLLLETDLPIKTVSYLSGFPSRERMRIMFIEREGAPPRDFRDRERG